MQSLILVLVMSLSFLTVNSQITYPYNFTYDGNPMVRNHSATDPNAVVWNDTVWVYCSQDHLQTTDDLYASMDGYHVFSTTDMKNWTDYGEILHSRDVSWGIAGGGFMFAPGAAHKNGKYYLYFPHRSKAGDWRTGVAISDKPQGPFTDVGNYIVGTSGIDPAVLVDDDGEAYIYFDRNKVAKLKDNMIELAESPRDLIYGSNEVMSNGGTICHEGPFMHKRNGKYYFSYTNLGNKFGAYYAMGDSPYGPFEWKGPLASWPEGAQDHHSIIEFKGQWYYFYHVSVPNFPTIREGHARIACFDRLYYNKDGTIQMIEHTTGPTKILTTNAPVGSIKLNPPGGAYAAGTKVTLTAGDLGLAFKSWSGDLSGTVNPTTITMNADKNVSATFDVVPTYILSTSATNGKVLLDPLGGVYNPGTVVTLTPVKDFGYAFSSWSGDLSGTKIPEKITMDSKKNVTANFVSVPTYKITSNATNGIIELNPPGGIYEKGTQVTVKALQNFGYKFSGWGGDLSGQANPTSLLMETDKNISSNFSYVGGDTIIFATNCGGGVLRSSDGIYYSADSKFSGGQIFSSNLPISGTTDDVLYQSERMGSEFSYKIPLPCNDYEVSLMFAEIYHDAAGSRVFDIVIEGNKVSSNLDIWAKVGKNAAYSETHTVRVSDGELNISFTKIKDNAKISAIYILKTK